MALPLSRYYISVAIFIASVAVVLPFFGMATFRNSDIKDNQRISRNNDTTQESDTPEGLYTIYF